MNKFGLLMFIAALLLVIFQFVQREYMLFTESGGCFQNWIWIAAAACLVLSGGTHLFGAFKKKS